MGLSCVEVVVATRINHNTGEEPMTQCTKTTSPLRQRLIEDMTLRKLSPKTQSGYIRAVKNFTRFLGRSPDTATAEDLRRYQLHLVESGIARPSLNAAITALRFFFEVTLGHAELMAKMSHVREPRKLPVILSLEEVTRLLDSAPGLKYQAALAVAYGAGLRASEVVSLKVTDIDSQRMVIRVEQGKGRKDRYAMLSPTLLTLLRVWWREAHARGKMLPNGWLFPGQNPVNPTSRRRRPSTSGSRCTRCAMRSPPICWSRRRIFASSRCCSATRSSRPPPSTARSPPAPCARSPVHWSI